MFTRLTEQGWLDQVFTLMLRYILENQNTEMLVSGQEQENMVRL